MPALNSLCGVMRGFMSVKLTEKVLDFLTPYAQSLGLEIIEVEYAKKFNGMNLTIIITKDGGIGIQDCERLHRLIDAPLDELNPTCDAPYILNVSSAGIDRPFKTERDFLRHIGKEIEIKLYAPLNGKKSIDGLLIDFNGDIITVESDGDKLQIPFKTAAKVTQKIIF